MKRNAVSAWLLSLILAYACSDNRARPAVEDAATGDADASADAGTPDLESRLPEQFDFWKEVEIDALWAERYATLSAMVAASDAAFVGVIQSVARGPSIRGDTREDGYAELLLTVGVEDRLRGASGMIDLLLVYPHPEPSARDVELLHANRPQGRILFVLRRRASGAFRPVNGHGIWAGTNRAALDAPLNPFPPNQGPYAKEVAEHGSIIELADALR